MKENIFLVVTSLVLSWLNMKEKNIFSIKIYIKNYMHFSSFFSVFCLKEEKEKQEKQEIKQEKQERKQEREKGI